MQKYGVSHSKELKNEMASLTKKEILAQLDKLGVSSTSDIGSFIEEYENYSSMQNSQPDSAQEQYRESDDK